ncbi:MAG: sigma-54-dependent Fis family transcriptional regulator [Candidatus Glassbacteria bacterium]|nr:sigma-54-dependent Fis family transcriptional regulator [Candidatus Glassbacteria bacterium]
MKATLFIVEDDVNSIELMKEIFAEQGYDLRCFSSPLAALDALSREGLPDLILTDLMMPEMDGIELLTRLRQISSQLPVIVMTAYGSIETAVEALKKGASDYITKPLSFEELMLTVSTTLELSHLRRRLEGLSLDKRRRFKPAALTGEHELMKKVRDQLVKVAQAETTCVLLRGESGTGKNLAARIIHYNSPLARGPFVELNCAAVPANLLESELFGYSKGAFTGAVSDKQGIIEQADGGTLFLDEIGEMPLEIQSKMLNFLESRQMRRLGGLKVREVNTRLITASNHDLEAAVDGGSFRRDLFFRINVVHCQLPPLRELGLDVLIIAGKFVDEFNRQFNKHVGGISPQAEQVLLAHDWPGNVRELRNVVERAMLFCVGKRLEAEDIQLSAKAGGGKSLPGEFRIPAEGLDWQEHERAVLSQALARCGNNRTKAARLLSMSRDTFIYRLKKFGLD